MHIHMNGLILIKDFYIQDYHQKKVFIHYLMMEKVYIKYLDMNNLYGDAMSKNLEGLNGLK